MSGKKISNDFLFYLIQTEKFTQIANVSTGTKMPRADWDYMQEIPFSIPPLKEQEKIARILGVWDSAIDSLANLIKAKRKYKTALMQRLLTPPRYTTSCHTEGVARSIQKDDLQGNDICLDSSLSAKAQNDKEKNAENGREINPQNDKENTHNDKKKIRESSLRFAGFSDKWQEFQLGDIGFAYGGLTNKTQQHFNCGQYKYITYKNIFENFKIDLNILESVDILENESQNAVKFGDVFFTISSEMPQEVGMCSVLLDELKNTYLNSFCFGFRANKNILYPNFASYYFRNYHFRKDIYKLAQGSTRYNISKNEVLNLKIKLPTIAEQKKIAQVLSACDKEIETLNLKFECLKAQKKGLMQQLLSGKVRVKC